MDRLKDTFDARIPKYQAGFRNGCSTTEHIVALASDIEAGFERQQKIGAVLIDLSAAYVTVWTGGLMLKLAKAIRSRKTLQLLK